MADSKHVSSGAMEHPHPGEDKLGIDRLVFFSDAVYAIAITLLVIDIRLPAATGELGDRQLWGALLALWPKYLAYALSFWVIAGFWSRHHAKFSYVRRYDSRLILLNLLNLMFIAFLPFPTSVIAEYGNRSATIFYALSVALAGLSATAVSYYILRDGRFVDGDVDPALRRRAILRSLITPAIFLISIGLALLNDTLAQLSWLLLIPAGLLLRDPKA